MEVQALGGSGLGFRGLSEDGGGFCAGGGASEVAVCVGGVGGVERVVFARGVIAWCGCVLQGRWCPVGDSKSAAAHTAGKAGALQGRGCPVGDSKGKGGGGSEPSHIARVMVPRRG